MVYRVEIAGRVFEGKDPKTLVRLAVQVRKGDQVLGENVSRAYPTRSQEAPESLVNYG